MNKIIYCPHCKKELKKVGIGFSQNGTMLYKVSFDGENLQYETDEFGDNDGGEFFCRNCGETLLFDEGDEDIKRILK